MEELKKISHETLRASLRRGAFRFYFRKISGDLRVAIGTLNMEKIPKLSHPKGGKISDKQTAYYDLVKGEWRSVSKSQEIWKE